MNTPYYRQSAIPVLQIFNLLYASRLCFELETKVCSFLCIHARHAALLDQQFFIMFERQSLQFLSIGFSLVLSFCTQFLVPNVNKHIIRKIVTVKFDAFKCGQQLYIYVSLKLPCLHPVLIICNIVVALPYLRRMLDF